MQRFLNPTHDASNHDLLSSLPYDVLRQVCTSASSDPNFRKPLNGLSRSSRHLRDVSSPELFRNVGIEGPWEHANSRLKAMEGCHAIFASIRVFKFDLWKGCRAPPPPRHMPSMLANVLSAMPQLEKLEFVVPKYHSDLFNKAFHHANLAIPSVDVLIVGPYNEFMVTVCPNITTLSTNGRQWLDSDRPHELGCKYHSMKLIEAAGAASRLRHFEMMARWEIFLLQALLEATPNITSIAMDGDEYYAPLKKFLPALSCFRNLRTLALAGAHCLDVGFDPPECGNVYMGPGGDEYLQQVRREGKEAELRVAHMVFPVCASLRELWIGKTTRAVVDRSSDGSFKDITMSEVERAR